MTFLDPVRNIFALQNRRRKNVIVCIGKNGFEMKLR
jgi:hypothetical protein